MSPSASEAPACGDNGEVTHRSFLTLIVEPSFQIWFLE